MSFIKTAVSFILVMISILFNTIEAGFVGNAPEPKSETELTAISDIFDGHSINEEITVIKSSYLVRSELMSVIALQGLVAKEKPSIFIDYGQDSNRYALNELEKAGYEISYNDESGNPWKFKTLVDKFRQQIADGGYILYATTEDHGQLNTATNLATINGWLPVSADIEQLAIDLGLEKKADISGDKIDLAYLKKFYKENKDSFRKDSLVHLYSYTHGLRDFAIQQGIFVMYIEDSDFTGRLFRDKVMRDLEPSSIILGWCQYEVKFTQSASRFGHTVIPSDHSYNVSMLSSFDSAAEKFPETFSGEVNLDPDKHYVAIVYSDGDNLQWIQNGFNEYHTWQSYNSDVPVTWTFPPIASELAAVDVARTLNAAKEGASFITGPSGGGYSRVSEMSRDELIAYSDYTASIMQKSGLDIMTFLDEVGGIGFDADMQKRLGFFARYDNIRGGILQLDPDRYAGGGGRVYFANGKPFISVGFSLWHPSGDAAQVTNEWLAEQAAIINAKPADITTINGYTVINVHPWTVGPDDLAYFVSQLGDNIEVLPAEQLLAAVEQNIPHEFAQPK